MNKLLASFNLPWYVLTWKKYLNFKYLLFGGKKLSCVLKREGRHRFKSKEMFDLLADFFFCQRFAQWSELIYSSYIVSNISIGYMQFVYFWKREFRKKQAVLRFWLLHAGKQPCVLDVELFRKLNSFSINVILPYLNFDIKKGCYVFWRSCYFLPVSFRNNQFFVTLVLQINCFCMVLLEDWGFTMWKFCEIFLAISVS